MNRENAHAQDTWARDRVAVITGGASGIGLAITEQLVALGARVAVWDIRTDRLEALEARFGDRVMARQVDVSSDEEVRAAAASVAETWGGIDHLVNNAGVIGRLMRLDDLDADEIDRVLAVNLKSVFYATAAFVRHPRSAEGRSVVMLSSIAARTGGMVGNMVYAASKGAIATLTKSFAKELAPQARVNALAPGIIDTEIQQASLGDPAAAAALASAIPLERLGTPGEVAEAAVWLLSPASAYVNSTLLDVAGGR